MGRYMILFLSAVLISSFSQILLKKSAGQIYGSKIKEYLNAKVLVAYALFLAATLVTLYAYRVIPLSMGPILEASGYVWVALLSWLILREKMKKKKIIGLVIIIVGIVFYSI